MSLSLNPSGPLDIEFPLISLCGSRPVLNGTALEECQVAVVQREAGAVELRYTAPALRTGAFGLAASGPDENGRIWLRYWTEGLPDEVPLHDFGIRFDEIENLCAYLRHGYFSWDGSFYVQPEAVADFEEYETHPEIGYGMTQLLPCQGTGSLVMGFDRHDRFQQAFVFDTRRSPPSLTVLTLWDRKDRASQTRCESERLVIFQHPEVEEALREWACVVAVATPKWPGFQAKGRTPITGWCSWYSLYAYITEENILNHLRGAAEVADRENLPMRVFQIDDGFTPEMGDWLEVKPQFPRGMKPLLDDIRAEGFVPGLWIAPFMVGNRSHLYRDHPDWVVRDRLTGGPLAQLKLYGEFRWHKRSEEYYILDATHPQAFEYLRRVFRIWRRQWGCEYFKTDFMHFGSEHGPDRAMWHTSGLTRIEIWRRVGEMIREEIGDAIWLGCGCPLWASVGLVDAIRIGGDMDVEWQGDLSAHSLLRNLPTRNFANNVLWQIDPDCVLLRDRYHYLTDAEVRSLAIYAGMSGGVMMASDHLGDLSAERLRLWKLILGDGLTCAPCRFPFLGQAEVSFERLPADLHGHRVRHSPRPADPMLVQVRTPTTPLPGAENVTGEKGPSAVFFFNTGDRPVQRTYSLVHLGLDGPLYVFDWLTRCSGDEPVGEIPLTLAAHEGVLLFLSRTPIPTAPENLPG